MSRIQIINKDGKWLVRVPFETETAQTTTVDLPANTERGAQAIKRALEEAYQEQGRGKNF